MYLRAASLHESRTQQGLEAHNSGSFFSWRFFSFQRAKKLLASHDAQEVKRKPRWCR
jgi:hypothetical protein